MTPQEIFIKDNIYMGQVNINGIECTVGYIKKFKWSWMATQLNTLIFIGKTNEPVNNQVMDAFSNNCYEYALKNHKGWPRGIQAGVGSIAILQATNIDESARQYCLSVLKKHWSAFEIPVLLDLNEKKMYRYVNAPIWGKIYFPFFTKTITEITNKL